MPEFVVRIHDPHHGVQRHRVHATDLSGVAATLKVAPEQVLSAQPVVARDRTERATRPLSLRLFSQDLAVLLDAGIPLVEALQTLRERQGASAMAKALDGLVDGLRRGLALSQAMAERPGGFDPALRAVVAANERTGQLATALRQHAEWLAWLEQLRSRVSAAMAYPMVLLSVGGGVIVFLVLFVLPKFAGVLGGLGQELPWATLQLMAFSHTAIAHPALLGIGTLILVTAVIAALRSATTRQQLLIASWRLPWLGRSIRGTALARLYRTTGMLLAAGVPAMQALDITRHAVSTALSMQVGQARALVQDGLPLSEALDRHDLLTPVARRMLRVGEHSGEVAAMLARAAAFHDEELVRLGDFVTRVLNPLLMLLMGVLIGGIVVLMYLPIFQLVEQVQ